MGQWVDTRDSEEASRSFWRGFGDGEDEVGRESSRVSAIWRTNGSKEVEIGVKELALGMVVFLGVGFDLRDANFEIDGYMDVDMDSVGVTLKSGVKAETAMDGMDLVLYVLRLVERERE